MRLIPADEDEWLLAAFHTVATTFIALTIIPLIWFAFLVPNRYLSKNGGKLTVVDIAVVVERVGERLLHCRPVLVLDLRHAVPGVVGIDRRHPVGVGILRGLTQSVVIDIPHLRPRRGDRAQLVRIRVGVGGHIAVVIVHRDDVPRRIVGIRQRGIVVVRDRREPPGIVIGVLKFLPGGSAQPVVDLRAGKR